jgi:hypothetical protein
LSCGDVEGRLGLEVDVFLDALDADDAVAGGEGELIRRRETRREARRDALRLHLSGASDDPVERLGRRKRVAQHQTDNTGVDGLCPHEGENSERRRREDDDRAEELCPNQEINQVAVPKRVADKKSDQNSHAPRGELPANGCLRRKANASATCVRSASHHRASWRTVDAGEKRFLKIRDEEGEESEYADRLGKRGRKQERLRAKSATHLIPVDSRLVFGDKSVALTVGTNRRDTSKSLLERSEDGRLGSSVESFELARSGEVVTINARSAFAPLEVNSRPHGQTAHL